MSFCPNCGAEVPETSKFCTNCGAKMAAAAPAQPAPAPAAPVYQAPAQPVEPAPAAPVYQAPAQPVEPAPAAPAYQAPAQPAYKAPAQPAYKAPAQQPVTPPAPPSPAEPPKGGKAPKEKKPLNKKTLMFGGIGLAVVLVVVILIIALGGGGADADDPNLGLYNAVSCTSMGLDLGCEGEWIELKAKGKADLNLFGEEYSAKWSLDGDKFVLSQGGDDYEGSLKNGVLTIDFAGLLYTYEKEGGAANVPADPGKDEKPDEPADTASEVGYWTLLRTEGDPATAMDEETVQMLKEMGMEVYIVLNADGTGSFMMDELTDITWADGKLTAGGDSISYKFENDQLMLDVEGSTFIYVRGEGNPPSAPIGGGDDIDEPDEPDEPVAEGPYAWWDGEWYGWWIVQSGHGVYEEWEDYYWDAYARIDVDGETGWIDLWDEDTDADNPLASMEIYFTSGVSEHGTMRAESGYFMDYEIQHADWSADPGAMGFDIDELIWIDFKYIDPANDDDYMNVYVFLRPWGMEWDDVAGVTGDNWPYDDMMPAYYYDWYLPLIEAGESLPDSFADGLALIGGGTDAPTASGDALASGVWDGCTVEVVGAEHFIDGDGEDAIRVFYYFTNTSDESIGALDKLSINVTQDGYDIFSTYSAWDEEAPEEGNDLLTVRPGVSILCCDEFSMKATGGNVVMEFYNWWDESESFTVEFDPQNLPGRPAEYEIAPITNPGWVDGLSDEATVDGEFYAYIDWAELLEGYNGDVVRMYFDYTNLTNDVSSPFWGMTITLYQDGVELPISYLIDPIESDDAYYNDVEAGASVSFSICFDLRSVNPIEVEICDFWGNPVAGALFELS